MKLQKPLRKEHPNASLRCYTVTSKPLKFAASLEVRRERLVVMVVVAIDLVEVIARGLTAGAATATVRRAGKTVLNNWRLFTQSAPGGNTVRRGRSLLSMA